MRLCKNKNRWEIPPGRKRKKTPPERARENLTKKSRKKAKTAVFRDFYPIRPITQKIKTPRNPHKTLFFTLFTLFTPNKKLYAG